MPPKILPSYDLPFVGAGAEAERTTLKFLGSLPDNYFVLRELRVHPTLEKRRQGSKEDRIDFVVIGPTIGVIVLEVKDWNIRRNLYEFVDQNTVRKTDEKGEVVDIRHPWYQVNEYSNAVKDLLKDQLGSNFIRVTDLVIYPRLTQAEFENAFIKGETGRKPNVQDEYVAPHMKKTFFNDNMANYWDEALNLLIQYVRMDIKVSYEEELISKAVDALIPPKFRVGDTSKQTKEFERLLLMDEEQQKWAFSDEIKGKNLMLDVAGSGKTNVILSRAMHLVNLHTDINNFRVLVLTYSEALYKELLRLYDKKIRYQDSTEAQQYRKAIGIIDIKSLMEQIIEWSLGKEGAAIWRTQTKKALVQSDEYLEYKLPEKCQDILGEYGGQFPKCDYLFVDEVQDFSDLFLDVAMSLLKKRENIFMVGDIGQKLFERTYHLSDLGLAEELVRIRGTYRMYRSPKYIALLAWTFLRLDHIIAYELREEGYEAKIKSKNPLSTQPIFKFCLTREALLREVSKSIFDLVDSRSQARAEQVLCVGLPDTLTELYAMLVEYGLPVCWANEARVEERKVILADFVMSKGLERDYVYILDIDRLPDGSLNGNSLFMSSEILEKEARRSRIKIFVALTRAIREVHMYYVSNSSRFINELHSLQSAVRGA